jgi:hypothetical protein
MRRYTYVHAENNVQQPYSTFNLQGNFFFEEIGGRGDFSSTYSNEGNSNSA